MKKLRLVFFIMALAVTPVIHAADSTDGQVSPVPEPSTIALMGAGVAALGFAAWRRNRKR
ncbi:MAG: PEP-CTERM sorting domain-containing protein [Acidobacteriia bacterium]|nr:PEP-CTERM sorting domain-containing protein [Terriglobia bacterium]